MDKEFLIQLHADYGLEGDPLEWIELIKNNEDYKRRLHEDLKSNPRYRHKLPKDSSYINFNHNVFGKDAVDVDQIWKNAEEKFGWKREDFSFDVAAFNESGLSPVVHKTKNQSGQPEYKFINPLVDKDYEGVVYALTQDGTIDMTLGGGQEHVWTDFGLVPDPEKHGARVATKRHPILQSNNPQEPNYQKHITAQDVDIFSGKTFRQKLKIPKSAKNLKEKFENFYLNDPQINFKVVKEGGKKVVVATDRWNNEYKFNAHHITNKDSILTSDSLVIDGLTQFIDNSREMARLQEKGYDDEAIQIEWGKKQFELTQQFENSNLSHVDSDGVIHDVPNEKERQQKKDDLLHAASNGDYEASIQLNMLEENWYDDTNTIIGENDPNATWIYNANQNDNILERYNEEISIMKDVWKDKLIQDGFEEGTPQWENAMNYYITEYDKNFSVRGITPPKDRGWGENVTVIQEIKAKEEIMNRAIEYLLTSEDTFTGMLLDEDYMNKIKEEAKKEHGSTTSIYQKLTPLGHYEYSTGEPVWVDGWLSGHDKRILLKNLSWEAVESLAGVTLKGLLLPNEADKYEKDFTNKRKLIWDLNEKEGVINTVKNELLQKEAKNVTTDLYKTEEEMGKLEIDVKNTEVEKLKLEEEQKVIMEEINKNHPNLFEEIEIFSETNSEYEEKLIALKEKLDAQVLAYKYSGSLPSMAPSNVDIDNYNTLLEEYQNFRKENEDLINNYSEAIKKIKVLNSKQEKLNAKIETNNEKASTLQEKFNFLVGEEDESGERSGGEFDRIFEKYNWNVLDGAFKNNFRLTDNIQEWKETNKIDGGFVKPLTSPEFYKQLLVGLKDGIGNIFGGLATMGYDIIHRAYEPWNETRKNTSYYGHLDLINDIMGGMFGSGEQGNFFGSAETSMYEGSYLKGGKKWSLFADVIPFTAIMLGDVRRGNFKGMYSGFYKRFIGQGKNLSKSAQGWLTKWRMADSAYHQLIYTNYIDAKKMGLEGAGALTFAHILSTITGVSQMIMPDQNFIKGGIAKSIIAAYVNDLSKKASFNGIRNATLNFMKNMIGELGEEEFELVFSDLMKYAYGYGHTAEFADIENQKATFAGVIMLGGGLSPLQLTNDYRSARDVVYKDFRENTNEVIEMFNSKIDIYTKKLEEAKANKDKVAMKEYGKLLEELKTGKQYALNLADAIKVSPKDIGNNELELLVDKKTLIDKKEKTDSALHEEIDKKIEAINNKLKQSNFNTKVEKRKKKNKEAAKRYAARLARRKGVDHDIVEVSSAEIETRLNEDFLETEAYLLAEKAEIENILKTEKLTKKQIKQLKKVLTGIDKSIDENADRNADAGNQFATFVQKPNGDFTVYLNADKQMVGTAAHETLHALLFKTFGQSKNLRDKLGNVLINHINKLGGKGGDAFNKRMSTYGTMVDGKFVPNAKFGEELLTVMSESLLDGSLQFNENVLTKIGDIIRRHFQRKYPNSRLGKIKFNTGRQVYNFIKDFNHSIEKDYINKAILDVGVMGAEGKLVDEAKIQDELDALKEKEEKKKTKMYHSRDIDTEGDIKGILDEFVRGPGGGGARKYITKKDFQDSEDYTNAWLTIQDSNLLDGSIRKMAVSKGIPQMILDNKTAMKNFTKMVKENAAERLGRNFNPAQNESLFGWLFGGKTSPLEGAVLDIIKDETALLNTIPYDTDPGLIDVMGRDEGVGIETEQKTTKRFLNTIKVKQKVKDKIENTTKKANINLKNLDYKGVKKLLTGEKAPLKEVLNEVSNMFGISADKITSNKDLDSKQRAKAQKFINENAQQLIDMLPEGTTVSGKATGVAPTLLKPFYTKGKRVSMSKTGSKQGLAAQIKNKNINISEFKNVFGVKEVGANINNRSVDGAIRALALQSAMITANQSIRENAMKDSDNPFDVIALIGDGKSELMFSKDAKGSSITREIFNDQAANALRNYGSAGYTDAIDYVDASVENIVEQTALHQNRNLPQGLRYQKDIKQTGSTPSTIKELITPGGVWIGPKLYDDAGNGYGTINQTQIDHVEQTMDIGSTFHPSIDSKNIQHLFGIKDSGSVMYEGEMTYNTRSINPKGHTQQIKKLNNRQVNLSKEEKFCKDNNIKSEYFKYAQPMVFSGRVKEIIMDIKSQKGLKNKLKKLKEHTKEIKNINKGNKAVLKYFTLKLKQGYNNNKINDVSLFHLGKLQTNVIEGVRSLSSLEWLYLTEETQIPTKYNPPTKKKGVSNKEYYESSEYNNYVSGWEATVDYKSVFKKVKNNEKTKIRAKELDISLDLAAAIITIKKIKEKNEHIGASATTNREIMSHVYSNGSDMSIDLVGDSHVSFFGPKFLMDNFLDSKIEDPKTGQMVDNKISLEGTFRLTKFAGPRRKNIFHVTADMDADGNIENDVSDYIVKTENLYDIYNSLYFSKDNMSNQISKKSINLSKAGISKPQGISVLDFDDTLATTQSKVLFTAPDGTKGDLNAEEYAKNYETLSKEGYKFDFSQFEKVIGAKTAPLFNKALKLQKKFGPKNMFVLTARPAGSQKGIHEFLKSQGLNIPLKNITGLGNSTADAKALWIADKVGEGYNDFYFADDSLANVKAVDNILEQFDVKRKVQQARISFSRDGASRINNILEEGSIDLNEDFNIIVEETKGIAAKKEFSAAKARIRGEGKGKFKFFIPPSAEDFAGLCYSFFGKGKQGEKHHKWFKDNLFDPFAKGVRALNLVKQTVTNDIRLLKKSTPDIKTKLRKTIPGTEYKYEQAVRVYLWDKAGYDVPGLSNSDKKTLLESIDDIPGLKRFADSVYNIVDGKIEYTAPGELWLAGSISYDINEALNSAREKFLAQWIDNKNVVFSEKNLNKIEATYGRSFREALEDILWRMENGTNRRYGNNSQVNNFMDWINGSIGTTMFVNIRSAVLQGLSMVNFVNWHDNNPVKAAAAFANLPQFCKDFMLIFNSNWLKQRRSGLQHDVNAAEMMQAIKNSKNPVRAAIGYLLQKGFKPTQIMDSFAIASGGATFYRNRVNTYKKQGLSQKQAEDKAFIDLQEVAEEAQQSSRPDRISMQQASVLGKLILAFQNTPMQYMRMIKKAGLDLANGRGDWRANVSKIVYYGMVQNFIFYALQSALFALAFDDDEDEEAMKDKAHKKKIYTINGMLDTILRGSGIAGAVVSTLKNMILKYMEQEEKRSPDHAYTLIEGLNLSPPIGIKARKIYGGLQTWEFNSDVIKYMSKTDIDNPLYSGLFSITEGITNIPLSRLYNKMKNVQEAFDSDNQTWQRVALFLGWNRWNLGVQDDEMITIKQEISEIKKAKKIEEKLKEKYPGKSKEEIIKLEKQAEIKSYNKDEQEKTLLDLGLNKGEIRNLNNEQDRVNKILELHNNNPSKVDSILTQNKGYEAPVDKEKEKIQELYNYSKDEQVKTLSDLGLKDKEIKELKKEEDRVNRILELHKNNPTKVDSVLSSNEGYVKPTVKKEKKRPSTENKIYNLKKSQQEKTLLDLGLSKEEIKKLKYEKDRVEKILELRKEDRSKVDSVLSANKDYEIKIKEKKEKEDIEVIEKRFLKDQENERNKGRSESTITCAAVKSDGVTRCGKKIKTKGGNYCTIHEKTEKTEGGEKKRCRHIKPDMTRCKMQTNNKSGLCYYHD